MSRGLMLRNTLDPITSDRLHQIVIPRRDAKMVLEAYHDKSGHFGVQKTESIIRRRFYWIGMRADIEKWCKECPACALGRREKSDQKAPLHPIVSHKPLEIVAIDHLKLEPGRSGYTYVMTIIDHYTKFAVAVPVRDLTAKTTATVFWKTFLLPYGCPEKILTDRGSAFESQLFQELCALYNCQKLRTTAYHPQSNGLCEKMNQTIIHLLRTVPPHKRADWPILLPELIYMYNNHIHCSTGYTPYYLMFGRQGKLPADLALEVSVPDDVNPLPQTDWVSDHQRRLADANDIVEARMEEVRKKQQLDYDQNAKAETFQVGNKVWLKNNHRTSKLDTMWEKEPYIIQSIPYPGTDIYQIVREGRESQVVHRNRLKLCQKETIPAETKTTEQPAKPAGIQQPATQQAQDQWIAHLRNPFSYVFGPWMSFLRPSTAPAEEETLMTSSPELQPSSEEQRETEQDYDEEIALRRSDRSTRGKIPARYLD